MSRRPAPCSRNGEGLVPPVASGGGGRLGGNGKAGARGGGAGGCSGGPGGGDLSSARTAAACGSGSGTTGGTGNLTSGVGATLGGAGGQAKPLAGAAAISLASRNLESRASARMISDSITTSFGPPIMMRCSTLSRRTMTS
ncbi:MAG TPA: hypothetical protein VEQ35_09410 [Beijerinckia sp.]|nr:hypothetical protein [Beijerinckia sp.]